MTRTDFIERYGAAVPRYTSYPTAPHFHDRVTAATYRGWLAEIEPGSPASLYFHVPFCDEMCWYCGCHTKIVKRYQPVGAYVRSLAREMDIVAGALKGRPRITHVHWGGGTPTMLSETDFERLMALVRGYFEIGEGAEVAVEIDPRTLTEPMAETLGRSGVTRVSLGIQEFDPDVQRAINRVQSFELTAEAAERIGNAGIDALNVDLMYGLPGQTARNVADTVDLCMKLRGGAGPDRLSIFGYAHVPWMKSHQKMIDEAALPDGPARMEQAETAARRLGEHGYRAIGLDHFAKPDDPLSVALDENRLRRNFQGYTDDTAETLIGFGASAIGGLGRGYVQNAAPLRQYAAAIDDDCLAVVRGIELTPEDRMRRAVIERLMCDLEVGLHGLAAEHGFPDFDFGPETDRLGAMREDGLVELDGDVVRVTEEGRLFVRTVAAAFDAYVAGGKGRHSRAV